MRAVCKLWAYMAAVLSLPIITAIACEPVFHNYLLAWRPDGKVLAVQGQGVTFFDDNLQSPTSVTQDTNFSHSTSLVWNPAGDKLILIYASGTYLWQQSTEKLEPILGSELYLTFVTWSPDGKWIAMSSNRSIVIADAQSFQINTVLKDVDNPEEAFQSIAWSQDGTLLAGGTGSGKIEIWELQDKKLLRTLATSLKTVYSIAWDPNDNRIIAVGGYDSGSLYLWNVLSGSLVKTVDSAQIGPITEIKQIVWSPNGKLIAVVALDGVKILDAVQYKEMLTFDYKDGNVTSAAWSPDSSKIAIVGNRDIVRLWDTSSGKLLAEHDMTK